MDTDTPLTEVELEAMDEVLRNAPFTRRLLADVRRCRTALLSCEAHLEEMRQDKKWHPVGHCPVLDQVRAALGMKENEHG